MKILKYFIISYFAITCLLISANFCLADTPGAPATTGAGFSGGIEATGKQLPNYYDVTKTDPLFYVANAVKFLLTFVGIVFLGLIIYAGVSYMTSAGEKDKVKKAIGTMKSASFGIFLIIMSYSIINVVLTFIPNNEGGAGSGAYSNINGTYGTGYQNTTYRADCEDTSSPSYYDVTCCQYRAIVYGTGDSVCCAQTLFTATLSADDCKKLCGNDNPYCPTGTGVADLATRIDRAKAICEAVDLKGLATDNSVVCNTQASEDVARAGLPGRCNADLVPGSGNIPIPTWKCVWKP